MYDPLKLFFALGAVTFSTGLLLGGRFLYYLIIGQGEGHVQSVILGAILLGSGLLFALAVNNC